MISCYILYSPNLNRYYVGATQNGVMSRIDKHNDSYYGYQSFTAKTSDWVLYLNINCETFAHALRIEKKIKSMKSRVYIENLKKYPELVAKITEVTKNG